MPIYPQQSQIDLLSKIRNVMNLPHPYRKETAQPLAVFCSQPLDKAVISGCRHDAGFIHGS
jgi:hypothetical protein